MNRHMHGVNTNCNDIISYKLRGKCKTTYWLQTNSNVIEIKHACTPNSLLHDTLVGFSATYFQYTQPNLRLCLNLYVMTTFHQSPYAAPFQVKLVFTDLLLSISRFTSHIHDKCK
eukprot:96958_1